MQLMGGNGVLVCLLRVRNSYLPGKVLQDKSWLVTACRARWRAWMRCPTPARCPAR